MQQRCDLKKDCIDNSDEENCSRLLFFRALLFYSYLNNYNVRCVEPICRRDIGGFMCKSCFSYDEAVRVMFDKVVLNKTTIIQTDVVLKFYKHISLTKIGFASNDPSNFEFYIRSVFKCNSHFNRSNL